MNTNRTPGPSALDRVVATAVNGFEVARFGGLRIEVSRAPYDVVAHEPIYRLRHYFPDEADTSRPPVLLVPPLMVVSDIWDVSETNSAVSMLRSEGMDPWVVDFGDPDTEPGGARRTMSDHVLAVVDALARVRAATGQDVHLGGYSQGGVFAYLAAAYLTSAGVASVFSLGAPVEAPQVVGGSVPERLFWDMVGVEGKLLRHTGLPAWAVTQGFKWASPQRRITDDLGFLLALHDRESLLPREATRRFLKREGWIAWSGPALVEFMDVLGTNRLAEGGVVIGDRTVGFSDITCPLLAISGEADTFATPRQVRRIASYAPNAGLYEVVLPVGHFGLPVGGHARAKTWPGVAAWARWVLGEGELPDYVHPMSPLTPEDLAAPTRNAVASLTYGLGLAVETGLGIPQRLVRSGAHAATAVRELSLEAASQAPRLFRMEAMTPQTRVSYAGMLDATARSRGRDVAVLYADRAYTHEAVKQRVDNVVRGLLSAGVRKGEHVGVLMGPRPSAVAAVAALNRIGAVAVMLRAGGDLSRELELGHVTKVIGDVDHLPKTRLSLPTFVLGAGSRKVPRWANDLEKIDPTTVDLPAWYHPNPGRARDLAFILFNGVGGQTRADEVTNGRWATSALAAASASALSGKDTIYSATPLHHPSGLLLTTGAAAASGARLALTAGFDPESFWIEARRYGVTVVPYTWTMLHALVAAEPASEERDHAIRLFVGSGMPADLWRRVEQRFAPARVLELYASTRSNAILGNVADRKIGASGRPLPGTPEVRVVVVDPATSTPAIGSDGYAVPAQVGEEGLLLVAAEQGTHTGNDIPLRGVFSPDDAWVSTGDLFRSDTDGDLWYVDSLTALMHTDRGVVSPRSVENALGEIDAVDLVCCYQTKGGQAQAAVTLRPGATLRAESLNQALAPVDTRPDCVLIVDEIPMNSWYRPVSAELAADATATTGGWTLDPRSGTYSG